MRIRVYKITGEGERHEVAPARDVKGVDFVPPFQNWPVCDCPQHREKRAQAVAEAG